MIGIYKIENLVNHKIYIGQSNNIQRRFKEHKTKGEKSHIPVDYAIKKYGVENFSFEVIEECSLDKLNERESYWIEYFKSYPNGYNCNVGGEQQSQGINNGRAKLTEDEVKIIRQAYKDHKRQKEIYENFKNKISWGNFQSIWQGKTWSHIMPEVYTEENRKYYMREATNGEKSPKATLTDEEVIIIRNRYINETAKSIYVDFKDKLSFQTLQQILWGRHYNHLPVYSKKKKQWID